MSLHLNQRDGSDTQLRRLDLAKLQAERKKRAKGTKAR